MGLKMKVMHDDNDGEAKETAGTGVSDDDGQEVGHMMTRMMMKGAREMIGGKDMAGWAEGAGQEVMVEGGDDRKKGVRNKSSESVNV